MPYTIDAGVQIYKLKMVLFSMRYSENRIRNWREVGQRAKKKEEETNGG